MDDYFLKVDIPDYPYSFDHGSSFLLMGSCFAEHIGKRLAALRFKSTVNPNGILYNPLNIADAIGRALNGESYTDADLLNREEIILSWQHHGAQYGLNRTDFLEYLNEKLERLGANLKTVNTLVLTFGTAYHWVLKADAKRVVNCHKQHSSLFDKKLASTKVLASAYTALIEQIQDVNPSLQIILTVSPVRYKRDGIIENNRSKSRLLLLCEYLEEQYSQVRYFPAYELLIDGLRDYRFYASDRVHPSQEAVDFVWKQFLKSSFSQEAKELVKQIESYNRSREHKSLYPESDATKQFEANLKKKANQINEALKKYL